jgi:hypothetical protein
MKRARLATLALAAGLGLTTGCAGLSSFNIFHRNRDACCTDGMPIDGANGMGAGPVLGDFGPGAMPPPGAAGAPILPVPNQVPPPATGAPAPLPRLVPQPEQARPMPYTP